MNELLRELYKPFKYLANTAAILTAPVAIVWMHHNGFAWWRAAILSILIIAFLRGMLDVFYRKLIPFPSLFGVTDEKIRLEDILNRKRLSYWKGKLKKIIFLLVAVGTFDYLVWVIGNVLLGYHNTPWHMDHSIIVFFKDYIKSPATVGLVIQLPLLFVSNFLLFMGPMVFMGISQIQAYEPGDANWGVKIGDIRGQKEAKEEVRKIVTLWQSGELFVKLGGKRERGILLLGPPGTGKTMLAKAIATNFNCPIVTIPGSGFAQTFIGMDVVIVRYLARKAKKLADKWGGQCIVFIDEIDAVGMRRQSLGAPQNQTPFYGPNLALNPSEDLFLESKEWRDRLFERRAPERPLTFYERIMAQMPGMFGGGGTGQLALNQLLIVMDGIDNPPFIKRTFMKRVNTFLDALYLVPTRAGRAPLRLPQARPTGSQIYFIGATNVPLDNLDPALTRPGRMGRHIFFRTPTKEDRKDIFDLYINKVAHEEVLDTTESRDELARITAGYSPAMIDQICSMALTYASHVGRQKFSKEDILEAMVTVETGTAVGWESIPEEEKSTAIHEVGHAVCSHLYMKNSESTRLSIKRRGNTGGHHSASEIQETFVKFKSELFGQLVWGLGSLAAEQIFYGENTQGVGGDIQSTTYLAASMVGRWGMAPNNQTNLSDKDQKDIKKKFEDIGKVLMAGANKNDITLTPNKTRDEAILIGQAYVIAWNTVKVNKDSIEKAADILMERKEIFGDDLLNLLESLKLVTPQVDYLDLDSWPVL